MTPLVIPNATRAAAGEQARPCPQPEPPDGRPLEADAPQLVRLAGELHAVFAAAHRGEPVAPLLNEPLRRTRPWPQAGPDGVVWTVDRADPLAAAAALALLEFVRQHGQERLGLCDAARCADTYADTSASGRRRFCSTTCLSRHKVAAHRARQRQTQPR